MRITSNILGSLGAAVKRSLVGAFETDITVPPVVQATLILRDATRTGFQQTAAGLNSTSFCVDQVALVANGGLSNLGFCILDAGVWELDFSVLYTCNYVSNGSGFQLVATFSGGTITNLFNLGNVVALGCTITIEKKFVIAIDGTLTITHVLAGNAAAQSHLAATHLVANKLL